VQRKPSKKAHDAERRRSQLNPIRIQQHTALLLMRQLQALADEPDVMPEICWMDLIERDFVALTEQQQKQLPKAIDVLRVLLQNKPATDAQIRAALTPEKYDEYKRSFGVYATHLEDEWETRPEEIDEYLRLVKLGDFFNGSADRVAKRAAVSKHGVRYAANGRTTSANLRYKAESYYEQALMYLQGKCEKPVVAARLQQWFDRTLEFDPSKTTLSPDVVGVARLRGSRSPHCLDTTRNIWGATKGKHYRQREIIAESVYLILFGEVEYTYPEHKVSDLVKRLLAERDEKQKHSAT
jgi:hypothetical protein